ncbi:MAG: amidohydrolase [Gammaproteobacteria bacterium]|nr:amidohydrolase [Gammaproteobacteria bacterium]
MTSTRRSGAGLIMLTLLCAGAADPSGAADVNHADLVLKNGKIVTVDPSMPEVQALAATGHTITALGNNGEIEPLVGPGTRVIDLHGRLAIPGFIEGHGHLLALGRALSGVDLTRAGNWDEIVTAVSEAARRTKPGQWILGWGWHQEKWNKPPEPNIDGLPMHHALSKVSPDNPVALSHASGHAVVANALALQLADIDATTSDPPGGEIVRDRNGQPTGMLREAAQNAVGDAISRYQQQRSAQEIKIEEMEQVKLAVQKALANGVTTFHDAGASFKTIDLLKEMAARGELPIRLYVMIGAEVSNAVLAEGLSAYRIIGYGNDHLAVRAIRRMIDGGLGAHGAWLLEPYADKPDSTGFVLDPIANIERTAELAMQHGFQLNTHAIGDRANREVLDIYEQIFRAQDGKKDLRWRIEHAQHLSAKDIPRFAALGVIASMQGVHATSDGPWVPKRLGEQRSKEGAYAWRALWDAGAVVTNGTDAPVEAINPIMSFYSTVTRRMADGSAFFPEQRLTREEALKSYTINNAYAAFEEDIKGTLTPGKLADIVVLSRDILTVPDEQIPGTEVLYSIVGGEIVFKHVELP